MKDHVLYASIYSHCPGLRQKADEWLPGTGERGVGGDSSTGIEFLLGVTNMFWG